MEDPWVNLHMYMLTLRCECQLPREERGSHQAGVGADTCVQTEEAAGGGRADRTHNGGESTDQ